MAQVNFTGSIKKKRKKYKALMTNLIRLAASKMGEAGLFFASIVLVILFEQFGQFGLQGLTLEVSGNYLTIFIQQHIGRD